MTTSSEDMVYADEGGSGGGWIQGLAISVAAILAGGLIAVLIGGGSGYAGHAVIGTLKAAAGEGMAGLIGWITPLLYIALVISCCGLAAWIFRFVLRRFAVETVAKPMRQAPLTAAFGLLIILIYVIAAVFAPVLAPYGEAEVFSAINVPPGGDPSVGGDPAHILGTDQIGRDLLTRLIYGARNTVGIAFVTTCLAFLLGATAGFLAATLGGWVDQLMSRTNDVLMAIPQLIFALLLMTIASAWASSLGISLTIFMILIIAVLDSTRVFRLARAVGLNIVVMDYIEAAKLRGETLPYLIFKEILPNATAPLLAEFGLRFCFVFLLIAALSFLGLGIQPPLADWGSMVSELRQFISFAQWDMLSASLPLMAAGAIALLTVAVNFVVDWMLHRTSGLKE
ncbi:MAG: ABC transporter permease [Pseudomonadota bacterium]